LASRVTTPAIRIGVISDTHGLLRPEAAEALRGSDLILHAGDICGFEVVEALREIAPVTAVRGNNDHDPWGSSLPETVTVDIGGVRIHMLHDLHELAIEPVAEGVSVVVAGHSHQPMQERRAGILHFNPGSAGPRRFRLPVSVGRLVVRGAEVSARIVILAP
jgi:putative phosphoesterase